MSSLFLATRLRSPLVLRHVPLRTLSVTAYRQLEQQPHTRPSPPPYIPPPGTPTSYSTPLDPPALTATPSKPRITRVSQLPQHFGRNQIIEVSAAVRRDTEQVLRAFKAPIRFAFAYGSGVFRQQGYSDTDKPLMDFIFAVSHPSHFHAINMAQNPTHYSLPMRLLGSSAVGWMQEKGLGASVWFNIEVEVEGQNIKYGCISVDALCRDMLDWETLYISGRTQKPVRILMDDARVRLANQVNLASAVRTALLLLPEDFSELALFEEIAGLSYRGDFRMSVGENPLKVRNIVHAQLDGFRGLYGGLLKSFGKSVHVIGETSAGLRLLRQEMDPRVRADKARRLPVGLKGKVQAFYERKWALQAALRAEKEKCEKEGETELEERERELRLWERIVADPEFKDVLDRGIQEIVRRPTFNQSLKGILSAGPIKSLSYIWPKLKKKWAKQPVVALPDLKKKKEEPAAIEGAPAPGAEDAAAADKKQ